MNCFPTVIYNQRGIGFFIANDAVDVIRSSEKKKFLEEEVPAFNNRAALLGVELSEILK